MPARDRNGQDFDGDSSFIKVYEPQDQLYPCNTRDDSTTSQSNYQKSGSHVEVYWTGYLRSGTRLDFWQTFLQSPGRFQRKIYYFIEYPSYLSYFLWRIRFSIKTDINKLKYILQIKLFTLVFIIHVRSDISLKKKNQKGNFKKMLIFRILIMTKSHYNDLRSFLWTRFCHWIQDVPINYFAKIGA